MCGLGSTNSRDMTLDRWLLTSSEISIFHASHVRLWKICLGPLGPLILDTIYVIYAFGSMLSCILCEKQKFSESHKLKRLGVRNQFRAARFLTVSFIWCSMNGMERVVRNVSLGGLGNTNSRDMTLDRWLLTSSEISIFHASHVLLWKISVWDHSDH